MDIVLVEVCDSNPISNLNLEELEVEYPGVSVLRTECLSKCGLCEHNVYAYVNGHIVFAKDPDTCLKRIRSRIERDLAWLDEGE
ncbi:DUF1450 domain-containing protein [Alicyclobacillus fastidiosus]|uniref:DUF1450 domain-containing protein n=1 Tax=Alicyclobacillus fastidiosus TaxID=392011 RepID=A0ABV5ALI0_9BACL|nr:DUF1450 domain-containing protein [Alicyclobacillus fastidiosus]WEH10215.1 DUF1450 domain-containing protein [Alicyclobacillus fastidiosus]